MTPARRGPTTDQRLGRAALATALVFAVNGFLLASWVSRLPATGWGRAWPSWGWHC